MRLSDASHHDDAELLERHVLAQPGDAVDMTLARFRSVHPALILVTNSMLRIFRARLRGDPSETERWLAAAKPRLGGRLEWQKGPPLGQPEVSVVEPKIRRWSASKGQPLRGGMFKGQPLPKARWYVFAGTVLSALLVVASWSLATHHATDHLETSPGLAYTTANGQRANIRLPDGSTVALDVSSRLDVPADYAAGNHTLHLSGEALFTVPHHDATPFVVVAGSATTQVLGTSFLVRHYAPDSTTMVAVRDGKVSVHSAASRPVILASAQRLMVGRIGGTGIQRADLTQFSFATGVLTIGGVPLRDAILELDRWYDADIRLGDATLANRQIAGGFTTGSLADLAVVLEWTFKMRVVRDGRVLTLFPR